MYDDWDLIESSFAMQYNIRLREENDMTFSEFCTLLTGIMPKTPLGQIVSIRAEEDKDILKNFTKEQHEIRNEWRNRNNPIEEMTEEEKAQKAKEFQEIMSKMFGA
ncbi:Gp15 family bacteriophage protein [Clostridium beijerinckii]|uniref:Gp15 family bacteriophage protein n=1 Tax=Clostridium beijerinckii TaxID=1520 RepID=UPI0024334F11|nr:Gp15 family bacteriophage protein [Clostridium beijerinckii]